MSTHPESVPQPTQYDALLGACIKTFYGRKNVYYKVPLGEEGR